MAVSPADSFWGLSFDEEIEELWPEWTVSFPDLKYPIPNLLNDENFKDWSFGVESNLRALNLMGFIEGTERPPEWCPEEAHPIKGRNFSCFGDRSFRAFRIIYDSIKPILPELEQKGFWSFGKTGHVNSHDPKVLWDAIERWNTDVPYIYKCEYLKEFSNINRDQFSDLDEYMLRAWWLHERLREVNLAIPEDVQMGFVIEGLWAHHMGWAMVMEKRLKDGSLTFRTVIDEIRRLKPYDERKMKEMYGNHNIDGNCCQYTENNMNNNKNNRNNKRQQNNKRRRNSQGHRQQHNGVTKRYSIVNKTATA